MPHIKLGVDRRLISAVDEQHFVQGSSLISHFSDGTSAVPDKLNSESSALVFISVLRAHSQTSLFWHLRQILTAEREVRTAVVGFVVVFQSSESVTVSDSLL